MRVHFAIFIQNMGADFCYHVHLGVAGVPLGSLQITVIEFQFVSRTGMTQGMKAYTRQTCLFPQLAK